MKGLLIALVLPLWAIQVYGQNITTYGPANPQSINAGYFSDYSAGGTVVQAGGSVSLANGATYEHGNLSFQNNGAWTSQGSLDLFAAAGAVTISGSSAPDFANLQFQNGNTVALTNTGGANITGQLAFGTSSVFSTNRSLHSNGALRFADNATYTGAASNTQHVNGYVSKTGNDAFVFPVGSGTNRRTLSISAPATATQEYSVAWIAGDPGVTGDPSNGNALHPVTAVTAPIVSVSAQGQWDWIAVSGTGAGLTINVSIPAGLSGATPADLRLVGWNGTSWVNLSGTTGATGNAEGTSLSGTMIAGITAVGVGVISVPLPITFGRFTAQQQGCTARLDWTTMMEHNNAYFVVERSVNGRDFKPLAKVAAVGNSTTEQHYTYTDQLPAKGMNYYRIVQIDIDGQQSSTSVVQQQFDCGDGAVKVYPTVTKGTVYVVMPAGYEQADIQVMDMQGRKIRTGISGQGSTRTVQLPALAAGTYLLKVVSDNVVETFKLLYQP